LAKARAFLCAASLNRASGLSAAAHKKDHFRAAEKGGPQPPLRIIKNNPVVLTTN